MGWLAPGHPKPSLSRWCARAMIKRKNLVQAGLFRKKKNVL
jgi:hypothetical protein